MQWRNRLTTHAQHTYCPAPSLAQEARQYAEMDGVCRNKLVARSGLARFDTILRARRVAGKLDVRV